MRAALGVAGLVVEPGKSAAVTVEVTNSLEVIDGITVSLTTDPGLEVVASPPLLPLFPDGTGTVTLTMTASAGYAAGVHDLDVVLRSAVDPDALVRLPLAVEVTPTPVATLSVSPPVRGGRSRATFAVAVENRGNTVIELTMAASDTERSLSTSFASPTVTVQPGTAASTDLVVRARRRWLGSPTRRPVAILGTGSDLELSSSATFAQRPVLPRGLRTTAILALVVAVWATVFVVAIDHTLNKAPLTMVVSCSFYASSPGCPKAPSSPASLTSDDGSAARAPTPPGGVPKSGIVIGVGGTINGTVFARSTGSGVGLITVQALLVSPPGKPLLAGTGATDSSGDYSIDGLLPGDYRLVFEANGFDTVRYPGIVGVAALAQTTGADVTIDGKPGEIQGIVDTGQSPAPPVHVDVWALEGRRFKQLATVTTDRNGRYTIKGLPSPDTIKLTYLSKGYQPSVSVDTIDGGQNYQANKVTLVATDGTLVGTVRNTTGNLLGGVTVTATDNGRTITTATPTEGQVGQFTLPNLETPGTYLLTLSEPGYGSLTKVVILGPGQSRRDLSFVLSGGAGELTGTVDALTANGPGAPLPGVTVTVNGPSGPVVTQTLDQPRAGQYLVSGLSTSTSYTVTFSLVGYESETVAVKLTSSGQATVNGELAQLLGDISGTVRDCSTHAELPNVSVSVTDGVNVHTAQTTDDPRGQYSVTGLVPGTYTVTFSLAGYDSATRLVTLGSANGPTRNVVVSPDLVPTDGSCKKG